MTDQELSAIEERLSKASPGRWSWNVSMKSKHMSLETTGNGHGLEVVMDFERWGMGGARARFQDRERGLMVHAEEFCAEVPGREHHASWYMTIAHPDAIFIAGARKDVEVLLAEVKRLRQEVEKGTTLQKCPHGGVFRGETCPKCGESVS